MNATSISGSYLVTGITSTKQNPCMRHSRSFSLCETHCQRLRVLVWAIILGEKV